MAPWLVLALVRGAGAGSPPGVVMAALLVRMRARARWGRAGVMMISEAMISDPVCRVSLSQVASRTDAGPLATPVVDLRATSKDQATTL